MPTLLGVFVGLLTVHLCMGGRWHEFAATHEHIVLPRGVIVALVTYGGMGYVMDVVPCDTIQSHKNGKGPGCI